MGRVAIIFHFESCGPTTIPGGPAPRQEAERERERMPTQLGGPPRVRTSRSVLVIVQIVLLVLSAMGPALIMANEPVDESASPPATEQPQAAEEPTTEPDPTAEPATEPTEAPAPDPTAEPSAEPAPPDPPAIWTSKDDYVPAELVDLTSSGWLPGEYVNLFVNDDAGKSWNHSAAVQADEFGAFEYVFRLPAHFVARYIVVATGAESGVAEWEFDDSVAQVGTPSTNSNGTGAASAELSLSATAIGAGEVQIAQVAVNKDFQSRVICPPSGWTSILRTPTGSAVYLQQTFHRVGPAVAGTQVFQLKTSAASCGTTSDNATGFGASGGLLTYSGVDTSGSPIRGSTATSSGSSSGPYRAQSVSSVVAGDLALRLFSAEKGAADNLTVSGSGLLYSVQEPVGTSIKRTAAAFATAVTSTTTGTFDATFSTSSEWTSQTVVLKMAVVPTTAPTTISDVSGSGTYGSTATLTAKLTSGATNLSGKTIAFTLGGSAVNTAVTDSNGVATLSSVSLAGYDAGTHTNEVGATFAGDVDYDPSNGSGDLVIGRAATITTVTCGAGPFTYTGSAIEPCSASVSGGTLNAVPLTVSYLDNIAAGTATASASFLGDLNHEASNDSDTFVIGRAATITTVTCPTSVTYTGSPLTPCTVLVAGANLHLTPDPVYTNNVNPGTATASYTFAATDNHFGSTDTKTFQILESCGTTATFLAPIKDGVRNIVKTGNVVPVKLSLVDCNGTAVTTKTLYIRLVSGVVNPGDVEEGNQLLQESVSGADSSGVMRLADGRYMYNLTTKGLTNNQSYTIVVRDGSTSGPIVATAVIHTQK
jgi:hypothetical protein